MLAASCWCVTRLDRVAVMLAPSCRHFQQCAVVTSYIAQAQGEGKYPKAADFGLMHQTAMQV